MPNRKVKIPTKIVIKHAQASGSTWIVSSLFSCAMDDPTNKDRVASGPTDICLESMRLITYIPISLYFLP